jgi:hypothetical protein
MLIGKKQAKVLYTLSSYRVIAPGDYVICAVTGKQIALEDLRYWNEARQEAYVDAQASTQRMQETANQ